MGTMLQMVRLLLLYPLLVTGSMACGIVGWLSDGLAGSCSRQALELQGRAMRLWRRA